MIITLIHIHGLLNRSLLKLLIFTYNHNFINNLNPVFLDEGASRCLDRPPCSNKDMFQIHTPCDNEGKVIYICTNLYILTKYVNTKVTRYSHVYKNINQPLDEQIERCNIKFTVYEHSVYTNIQYYSYICETSFQ